MDDKSNQEVFPNKHPIESPVSIDPPSPLKSSSIDLSSSPPKKGWVLSEYQKHCERFGVSFTNIRSVKSPDSTTLFCSSGMQKHKGKFGTPQWRGQTLSDSQQCLRTGDLEEVGDGRHILSFSMLGLFSFEDWSMEKSMDFWLSFMRTIGIEPTHITVHPEGPKEWVQLWRKVGFTGPIVEDTECIWSDGSIGGFCTEMYVGEIEIGNIVNPLGHSIDCGFGLERLELVLGVEPIKGLESLMKTLIQLESDGFEPGPKKSQYVVRKIVNYTWQLLQKEPFGGTVHPWVHEENERMKKVFENYKKHSKEFKDKDSGWWFDTFGVRIDEFSDEQKLSLVSGG